MLLHIASVYAQKLLHRDAPWRTEKLVHTGIAAPKPDLNAKAKKKTTILKHFLKGKLLAPKWRKSADKSLSQPSCSHSNTIYEVQLGKTIVLRMQPRQEAAAITMRSAKTELQNTIKVIELRATALEIAAPKPDPDAKAKKRRRFWSTFEKDL